MRKIVLAVIVLLLGLATPASAYEPVNIVHTEKVQAGPYALTIGFSTWPLKAMQSLDFTFAPRDGVADKTGFVTLSHGKTMWDERLARHPRKREVWGLDVRSLSEPGDWTLRFDVDGPAGPGTGELTGLRVLEQPGPPLGLSWAISTIPLVGLIGLLAVAWRRTRHQVC